MEFEVAFVLLVASWAADAENIVDWIAVPVDCVQWCLTA